MQFKNIAKKVIGASNNPLAPSVGIPEKHLDDYLDVQLAGVQKKPLEAFLDKDEMKPIQGIQKEPVGDYFDNSDVGSAKLEVPKNFKDIFRSQDDVTRNIKSLFHNSKNVLTTDFECDKLFVLIREKWRFPIS